MSHPMGYDDDPEDLPDEDVFDEDDFAEAMALEALLEEEEEE